MTWIKTIPEDEATGYVAKAYAATVRSWGDEYLDVHDQSVNARHP